LAGHSVAERRAEFHRPRLAAWLLAGVFVFGTIGYMVIERWSFPDAFYMTVISVTTAGYREVHPLSRLGEVWTEIVLVAGVGTLFYTASLVMAFVVEGRLYDQWGRRKRERMIDELSNHFIICGYGRIGQMIVAELRHRGVPLIVIERDPERCHGAIEGGLLAVAADSSNEEVLKRIGIERARGLIAAVGTDAENVYTVLSARLLNPKLFIVSRAETEESRRRLERAGADRVVSPYQIGAVHLAQTALHPAVVDFMQFATSAANQELNMEQIKVEAGTLLAGQTILEANLRQRFGAIVVGIQRADGKMEFNPAPETRMHAGDQLVVLGPVEQLRSLEQAAAEGAS
jgi:voltage-gated potassium channel